MRPRFFVASSSESLDIAYAIQENLERDGDVTVWPQGIFQPTLSALESLVSALEKFDFGLFVFSGDDVLRMREREFNAVRDNVLFELGLFVGRLGRARTFILTPRSSNDLRMPTDLVGVTPLTYNDTRSDDNLLAALGPACNQIRKAASQIGLLSASPETQLRQLAQSSQLWFHLINHQSAKSIDVKDWATSDGSPIQQWLYHAGNNQMWALHQVDSHYFWIESKHSGKCITVLDALKESGALVVQETYKGRNHQKWRFETANSRSYRIIAKHSGHCLSVRQSASDNGELIISSKITGGENQMWWLNVQLTSIGSDV